MRAIDTKLIRNLGFIGMLATLPLAQASLAARSETCGPYLCYALCPSSNGGYILADGCDYCDGSGCTGGGEGCDRYCYSCFGDTSWTCY